MEKFMTENRSADEEDLQKEREKWVRLNNPAVAKGRGITEKAPFGQPHAPLGGSAQPANPQPIPTPAPATLPLNEFIASFKMKRGRPPTQAELDRAKQQGYIQ